MTRRASTVLIIAAVGALTILAWRQNGNYRDEIALYNATLDKNPDSWIAHYTLGFALVEKGQGEEGIENSKRPWICITIFLKPTTTWGRY